MANKKIAIFCGGPSSEHEVSVLSSKNIYKFIDKSKYSVVFFYITKGLKCRFTDDLDDLEKNTESHLTFLDGLTKIKSENYFALLAGLHGEFVEDGKIQTILEYFKIPYLGSGPAASSLAMDKYRASLLVSTLKHVIIPRTFRVGKDTTIPKEFSPSLVVKPNTMGSSIGVSIVKSESEFRKAVEYIRKNYPSQEIIAQEYLEGAIEIQCGVLQKKDGNFVVLPPIEIIPKKNVFFDYDSKYLVGGATEITPPVSVSIKVADELSQLSINVHTLLGLRTYSRNDFLIHKKKIYFLEANTLPGMTATSLLPQEAKAIGISYTQLLDFLIENA